MEERFEEVAVRISWNSKSLTQWLFESTADRRKFHVSCGSRDSLQ